MDWDDIKVFEAVAGAVLGATPGAATSDALLAYA